MNIKNIKTGVKYELEDGQIVTVLAIGEARVFCVSGSREFLTSPSIIIREHVPEPPQLYVCPKPCDKPCPHAKPHKYWIGCESWSSCPNCVPVPADEPEPPRSRYVEVPITIKFGQASWAKGMPPGQRVGFRYAGMPVIYLKHGPVAWRNHEGHLTAFATDADIRTGRKRLIVATHAVYTVLTTKDQEG